MSAAPRHWTALAATIAAGLSCGGDATPRAAAGAEADVALASVDTVTVDVPLSLPAHLYVEHDALVYARTTGVVESIYVDLGSAVGERQLLAQLEHEDQDIALALADEALARAGRDLARVRELARTGAVTVVDSEEAVFTHQHATLARRQARRNYDLTRVVAPFAGRVTARAVRPGRLVSPGDSLFRVAAPAPLRVAVHVPEALATGVAVGTAAQVVAASGAVAGATIIRASPSIDAASGTREIVLQLASAAAARLQPGMSVTVRLGAERRRVLAISREAISEQGYVLVWDEGRTVLRAVTLGAPLPDGRVEVVGGLAPGEQLVRQATP